MADNEAQKLKIQQTVPKATARTNISEESEVDSKFHHHEQKFVGSMLDIHRTSTGNHHKTSEPTMKHTATTTYSQRVNMSEILCKLVKQQSVPDADLMYFMVTH